MREIKPKCMADTSRIIMIFMLSYHNMDQIMKYDCVIVGLRQLFI